jgi:hypothetical protein
MQAGTRASTHVVMLQKQTLAADWSNPSSSVLTHCSATLQPHCSLLRCLTISAALPCCVLQHTPLQTARTPAAASKAHSTRQQHVLCNMLSLQLLQCHSPATASRYEQLSATLLMDMADTAH